MMASRQQHKSAAAKRAAASTDHDEIINALESEKAGYVSRGLDDRAKAVDAFIKAHKAAQKKSGDDTGKADDTAATKSTGTGTAARTRRTNRGSAKVATATDAAADSKTDDGKTDAGAQTAQD